MIVYYYFSAFIKLVHRYLDHFMKKACPCLSHTFLLCEIQNISVSMVKLLHALALLSTLKFLNASIGDRDVNFRKCTTKCNSVCDSSAFPLSLKLTRWSCQDDCNYRCMTNPKVQYFGKWYLKSNARPFYRFLGIQEPASVLFSILNGYQHFIV